MKIKEYKVVETNEYADKDTCRNGGGYFQPEWTIVMKDGSTLVLCDDSCGDFGTRYWASLKGEDGHQMAVAQWGTMLVPEEEYSSFHHDEYLFDVEDLTGIHIPTVEEVEW